MEYFVEKYSKNQFWNKVALMSLLCSLLILTMHTINNVMGKYELSPVSDGILDFIHWITHNAVKLFWMLSAVLFYRDYTYSLTVKKYKSRFKSLVVPYLSWNLLSMLFTWFIYCVPSLRSMVNGYELFYPSCDNIVMGLFHHKYNIIFWFIFELIILIAAAPLIFTLLKNKYIGIISILLFYVCAPTIFKESSLIRGGESWSFYLIAAYMGIHYFDLCMTKSKKHVAVISILLLLVFNFLQMQFFTYRLASDLITIISVCLIWWGGDLLLPLFKKWMIGISMFIYAVHFNIDMVVSKIIVRIIPDIPEISFLVFALAWITTVVLSISIALTVKKYIPKLYSLLNGGR